MAILIVPGSRVKSTDWQSRWESQLDFVHRVEQPETARPQLELWLETLREHVGHRPNAVLVGHGLGATVIAHLAARYPDLPIRSAMLVAPVDPEARTASATGLASFGPLPCEPFPFPAFVVASRTDPHMAIDRARIFANMWDAAFIDVGNAGHLDADSGLGDWPAGLDLLERLTAFGAPPGRSGERFPTRLSLH
ncbi:RBBP9/YdeN family alpha/beta hydrolase [Bosea sp. NPDC055332]